MKKLVGCCCLLTPWLWLVPCGNAQAVYTAANRARLQFGAGALYLRNDYSSRATQGAVVWGDLDFSRHFGIEATVRFGGIRAPDGIAERSYTLGPRVSFQRGRWNVFGTFAAGQGTISNQRYNTASTYNLYDYGAGLECLVARHINLRLGNIDVQRWLSFEPHGLAPLSIAAGVSYVIP